MVDQQPPHQGYGQPGPGVEYASYGQPGAPVPPPAPQPSNGIAVVGLVLAFLLPPIGFILSVIGLIKSGRAGRRGVAIAGVVISLVITGALTWGAVALFNEVKDRVGNAFDPGCVTAKAAVLDNANDLSDPAKFEGALQATIDGLADAESKADADVVRDAVKVLKDDYTQLQTAVKSGQAPAAELESKMAADGAAFDQVCVVKVD
jgi:hypothetical protein